MADDADSAGELTLLLDDEMVDIEVYDDESVDGNGAAGLPSKKPMSAVRRAMLFGLAVVVSLAVLVAWLGFRVYQSQQAQTSATENHAVVLLFVNQAVTVGQDAPTNTASSVRVTLDKVDDRWLISGFDPV
jgi:hypothetical protein